MRWFLALAVLLAACQQPPIEQSIEPTATAAVQNSAAPTPRSIDIVASVVEVGDIFPPQITTPCKPCPFAGQTVTVIVNGGGGERGPISGPLYEVKDEFEAATGATLTIVEKPLDEHFTFFMTDLTTGTGQYDASIAGAWWLGDLVAQGFIRSYDDYYGDPRFPAWEFGDVQNAPRALLQYESRKYMVAHDHDGQVMYYRRDLLEDAAHQAAFWAEYNYPLVVPSTWAQFRDVAAYFDGQDLNGDGTPDNGLTMHLQAGQQGMFHFMSFSAPFVIGEQNPNLYWFDPNTMQPLIDSPGHIAALEAMVDLVQFGASGN